MAAWLDKKRTRNPPEGDPRMTVKDLEHAIGVLEGLASDMGSEDRYEAGYAAGVRAAVGVLRAVQGRYV